MRSILAKLGLEEPVLTDGAWGTALQQRGLGIGKCPDHWNLIHPDRVEQVARSYVDAGSKIILTNTFGASRLCLERYGLGDRTTEINSRGVEISKRAAAEQTLVFASMGPTGRMLAMGETGEEELQETFREQASLLAASGADGFVIETMSDLTEAVLAVQAARSTGLPVVACMVYESGRDKDCTMMGTTIEQATEALETAGADVIGANCGHGISGFIPICRRLRAATDRPLWIKANAGLPELVDGKASYNDSPGQFAEQAIELLELGTTFIGGCCGTDASFIRVLQERILKRDNR